jgi:hypothetical protein
MDVWNDLLASKLNALTCILCIPLQTSLSLSSAIAPAVHDRRCGISLRKFRWEGGDNYEHPFLYGVIHFYSINTRYVGAQARH